MVNNVEGLRLLIQPRLLLNFLVSRARTDVVEVR